MKINNSVTSVGIPAGDNQKRADKPAVAGSSPAPAAGNVHLSSFSSQLQALESKFASSGVVDAGRVEEIKQAISDGRFTVNAEAVADRLLETVRELIQSSREKTS